MKKQVMAVILSFALACMPMGVMAEEAPEPPQAEEALVKETLDDAVVTTLTLGANEVLLYHPVPGRAELEPVGVSCTAPLFIVFGEGAFDAQSADAFAATTGLAELAKGEGSSIAFINPVGEEWSEADAGAYEAVVGAIKDSSTNEMEDGISSGVNFLFGMVEHGIVATAGRIYVYGVGAGADAVASQALKPVLSTMTFPDGFSMTTNNSATAVTVTGLTDVSLVEDNDLPVVSIGASEEVNQVLEEKCGIFLAEEEADYPAEYATLTGQYRRQNGVLLPMHNYEEEGIVSKVETYVVKTSPDNMTFPGTEEHEVHVMTYYAQDLDVENGNVPLVLCFHGGGNTALYEGQATQWPEIGKENGFITVAVDLHHPNVTATEMVELIDQLKEAYSIDAGRIYASGFSMGGCKSWELFEQYPEVFAGLAPMDASNPPAIDSFNNPTEGVNEDVLVPVFYVAGETTPLPEMPKQDQKLVDRIANLFAVNKVTTPYEVSFDAQDTWEDPIWGVSGELIYAVTDQEAFTDSTMTVNLFPSEDGKYYTALALAGNQSHEVYARNSWAAWDFLSQFSRAEDGSILINPVTYALAADDGSVTDNSYNQ